MGSSNIEKKVRKVDYSIKLIARVHHELNCKLNTVTALLDEERRVNVVLRERIVALEMSLNQHT